MLSTLLAHYYEEKLKPNNSIFLPNEIHLTQKLVKFFGRVSFSHQFRKKSVLFEKIKKVRMV